MINVLLGLALTLCGLGLLFMNPPNHDYPTSNSITIRFFQNKIHLRPPPPARYLTFEYYEGRFGNQVQQMEWVYRVAMLTNRTLILQKPPFIEVFAGFPASWQRAHEEFTIWDLDLLKSSPVKLQFHEDEPTIIANIGNLPTQCVWPEGEAKFVVSWAVRANNLHECRNHLHLASRHGIPSEYRHDTREFGIDPLLFWKHVRFSKSIFQFALNELNSSNTLQVGVHARTFREAKSTQEKINARVCGPQTSSMPYTIMQRLRERQVCGCPVNISLDIHTTWNQLELKQSCDLTQPNAFAKLTNRSELELKQNGFFIATDHNDAQVDALFITKGGHMIDFTRIPSVIQNLGKWERNVEALAIDLAVLISTREFFGIPVSSLTRAVCNWRLAMGKTCALCELFTYRTYSPRCSEVACPPNEDVCCLHKS